MEKNAVIVGNVLSESIAEEAGIERGDCIVSINGEKIQDIFDYRFLIANSSLLIDVLKRDKSPWQIEIEKDEYDDIGIEFENAMIDEAKSCSNQCVFCFIDQLPKGLRETLYFKDDDTRLSFLTGNYVTLTNIHQKDIDRVIRYRMSPINVSVHTTNPNLRQFMLKNKFAGDVLQKIECLTSAGITVNCQIVLCKGYNDDKELDETIESLTNLYPGVNSISIVPVGLTRYREGLCEIEPYDKESSAKVIKQVKLWQDKLLKKCHSGIVYLADEFYIMAEQEIPDFEKYEDFPQIENGVGLIAMLRHEFFAGLDEIKPDSFGGIRNISIATGKSAYKYIWELAHILEKRYNGLRVNVFEMKNIFFGDNVTVTGLLTGQDLYTQLKDKELGDELLLCRCMLRAGETTFLDDMTVEMLAEKLHVKISIVENDGNDFITRVLGNRGEIVE